MLVQMCSDAEHPLRESAITLLVNQQCPTDIKLDWLSYAHCHRTLTSSYMTNMISLQRGMCIVFLQLLIMSVSLHYLHFSASTSSASLFHRHESAVSACCDDAIAFKLFTCAHLLISTLLLLTCMTGMRDIAHCISLMHRMCTVLASRACQCRWRQLLLFPLIPEQDHISVPFGDIKNAAAATPWLPTVFRLVQESKSGGTSVNRVGAAASCAADLTSCSVS